nr:WD40 repeat domain-containing protein [Streptomyces phytophilus]
MATGEPAGVPLIEHRQGTRSVAFSPGGRLLATACRGGSVRLWDAPMGAPVGKYLFLSLGERLTRSEIERGRWCDLLAGGSVGRVRVCCAI